MRSRTQSQDLTGSEANESRSETLPGERTVALSGGQEQVARVDPPVSTFGQVSCLEEEDARGNKDPPVSG